jgi:hypothetical protein
LFEEKSLRGAWLVPLCREMLMRGMICAG